MNVRLIAMCIAVVTMGGCPTPNDGPGGSDPNDQSGLPAPGSGGISGQRDADRDGLTDAEEAELGTSPGRQDSDNDAVLDGDEVDLGIDPLRTDTDGDGLPDGAELSVRLDPTQFNETGFVLNVYSGFGVELAGDRPGLWFTETSSPFRLWKPGDVVAIETAPPDDAIGTITNVTIDSVAVAIDRGPILDFGLVTDAAIDLTWIEVDGLIYTLNQYDAGEIATWSFGDFVLVTRNPKSEFGYVVNPSRGESVLRFP